MPDIDLLLGTVKGPGQLPQEYTFITRDGKRVRIGEFVYYQTEDGSGTRQIIGTVKARKLVRGFPDPFLADAPNILVIKITIQIQEVRCAARHV
ncbi:hypothetical protein [Leptolyngbya sp. 7M]|uniref:hypothetical protein n=1 Tax=Leptolyngbya sp. 7M TaxID=2812896 RepID=UPI001B8BAA6F|nr:hypothetical protein [Leptolyngbya sp. 7M]QYO66714.1 hypothetical protein JVX88_07895 [Leptolyngbya sp. 7M]